MARFVFAHLRCKLQAAFPAQQDRLVQGWIERHCSSHRAERKSQLLFDDRPRFRLALLAVFTMKTLTNWARHSPSLPDTKLDTRNGYKLGYKMRLPSEHAALRPLPQRFEQIVATLQGLGSETEPLQRIAREKIASADGHSLRRMRLCGLVERCPSRKPRLRSQLSFNAQKLVELRNTLASATRPGLDVSRASRDRKI